MKKLYNFLRKSLYIYISKGISGLSAQLSYYMLFTFFPMLLFVNTVLGKLLPHNFRIPLSVVIPQPVRNFAENYIFETADYSNSKLMFLGIILTIYSLTRYIRHFRSNLRSIYEKGRNFPFITDWIISFLFSISMLLLFYLAVFSVFFTDSVLSAIGLSSFIGSIWYIFRFFIVALFAFIVICALNYIECGTGKKFFDFAPGAFYSVSIWTIVSSIFSYYAGEIADYSVVYGSIGNVIMLLIWLNLTNTILLLSSIVNICLNKKP